MNTWRAASVIFQGGKQQINSLKGKRVRTKSQLLSARVYDPIFNRQDTTNVQAGAVGFVSNALGEDLLVAFPKQQGLQPASLEALTRGMFFVVIINAPTFRAQFEIEG